MIKFKLKSKSTDALMSIEEIMNYCEPCRKALIRCCFQYFEFEYEYAEDCVQEAYIALLSQGIEIRMLIIPSALNKNERLQIMIKEYEKKLFFPHTQ